MHLVLVQPEIPPNTGNVARTCVLTGTKLHLIKPLGFSLSDSQLKRSGLDYWAYLDLEVHESFAAFKVAYPLGRCFYYSTKGTAYYHEISYLKDDFLIIGCETKGLPKEVLEGAGTLLRVPMVKEIPRSLNLGNTAALVLYEALRQQEFAGLV